MRYLLIMLFAGLVVIAVAVYLSTNPETLTFNTGCLQGVGNGFMWKCATSKIGYPTTGLFVVGTILSLVGGIGHGMCWNEEKDREVRLLEEANK